MLYCKTCGAKVNDGDRFCEKCSARLDLPGAVLASEDFARDRTEGEFRPETAVTRPNLLAYEVFGYRLLGVRYTLFGDTYYTASREEDGAPVAALLRHRLFPTTAQYEEQLVAFAFDRERTDHHFRDRVDTWLAGIEQHRHRCSEAGIPCAVIRFAAYYNESERVYHLFVQFEEATPLLRAIESRKHTVRDSVGLMLDALAQVDALHKKNLVHGDLSDDNLFQTAAGTVLLGPPDSGVLDGPHMAYRTLFCPPDGPVSPNSQSNMSADIYASGVVLYRLLGGMRHPWMNAFQPIEAASWQRAEQLRLALQAPMPPVFAQNPIGNVAVRACSAEGTRIRSVDELRNILENSLNYLSSDELGCVCIDYAQLHVGRLPFGVAPAPAMDAPGQAPAIPAVGGDMILARQDTDKPETNRRLGVRILAVICAALLVIAAVLFLVDRMRVQSGDATAAAILPRSGAGTFALASHRIETAHPSLQGESPCT